MEMMVNVVADQTKTTNAHAANQTAIANIIATASIKTTSMTMHANMVRNHEKTGKN
jgi:hypothetical protein